MSRETPPLQIHFDATPEIFASDSSGSFHYPLVQQGEARLKTASYDEARFVMSIWLPSTQHTIDLDRAYVELRGSFDPSEEHWVKLAEVEPVVPPYGAGECFDGWIVLPVLGAVSAYSLFGSGFAQRTRLQIRVSAYLVA